MIPVPDSYVRLLRATFDDFLIAEVKRHNGIPELTMEDMALREAIAELLAATDQRVAHSRSEFKRLKASGANVVLPPDLEVDRDVCSYCAVRGCDGTSCRPAPRAS